MVKSKILAQIPAPITPTKNTWFILGREKLLSTAEISAVFHYYPESAIESVFKINKKIDPKIINQLGGTIKIAEEIGSDLDEVKLMEKMVGELKKHEGKTVFGVSVVSENRGVNNKKIGLEIKKALKNLGKSVRYIEGEKGTLNAAQIKYNKLIDKGAEFLIEKNNNKYNLAKTIACQDVDEFSSRDFGRPGRDDFSGMLPPKLAMMLINLAQANENDVILDPFCGSGTILTEAILMGYKNLIGSDISEKAIEDTQKNVDWVRSRCHSERPLSDRVYPREAGEESPIINIQYPISNIKILNIDATKISSTLPSNSADYIITEPYLGKPLRGNETEMQLNNQVEELKKLYLSAFNEFAKILKPNGKIIFVIPRFKFKNEWITIDIKDEIKKLGFWAENLLPHDEFLLYARPNQLVGREIWKFTKPA